MSDQRMPGGSLTAPDPESRSGVRVTGRDSDQPIPGRP